MCGDWRSRTPKTKPLDLYINDERRFIYFPIPKNASMAFRALIQTIGPVSKTRQYSKQDRKRKNYFHFTVLRNPLERFISFYIGIYHRDLRKARQHGERYRKGYWALIEDPTERLNQFIEMVEASYFDQGCCPQRFFLCDERLQDVHMDSFILHENLQKDGAWINGVRYTVPFKNRTSNKILAETTELVFSKPNMVRKIALAYEDDWILYRQVKEEYGQRGVG